MMANFKPFLFSISIIMALGLFMPFLLGFFIDFSSVDSISTLTTSLIDLVEDGFELDLIPFTDWDNFDVNPFSWLGTSLKNAFIDALIFFSILPIWIIAPLLTFTIFSFLLLLVSIVRGN